MANDVRTKILQKHAERRDRKQKELEYLLSLSYRIKLAMVWRNQIQSAIAERR